jgi:hypothetical protein
VLSEAYGGEAMKKLSVFEWYQRFKWKIMKDVVVQGLTESMKMVKSAEYCKPSFLRGNIEAVT